MKRRLLAAKCVRRRNGDLVKNPLSVLLQVGGKVASWLDKDGNHIEQGLHVFFGCYYNLFGIMMRTGSPHFHHFPAAVFLQSSREYTYANL